MTAVDLHGNEGDPSNEAATPAVSGVEGGNVPAGFALCGNHPNPFNPSTEIVFELPRSAAVRLAVYDVAGRRVASLLDEVKPAGRGTVRWEGRNDKGIPMPSGVYFASMTADDFHAMWKTVLAK